MAGAAPGKRHDDVARVGRRPDRAWPRRRRVLGVSVSLTIRSSAFAVIRPRGPGPARPFERDEPAPLEPERLEHRSPEGGELCRRVRRLESPCGALLRSKNECRPYCADQRLRAEPAREPRSRARPRDLHSRSGRCRGPANPAAAAASRTVAVGMPARSSTQSSGRPFVAPALQRKSSRVEVATQEVVLVQIDELPALRERDVRQLEDSSVRREVAARSRRRTAGLELVRGRELRRAERGCR